MKKKIHTSIVGLNYYEATSEIFIKINEGVEITLKPEPDNPHDKHAVAIFIESLKIGYIRAREAKQISDAMRSNSNITVRPEHIDTACRPTYLPATVTIEKNIEITPPKIAPPNTAGIYRIYSSRTGGFYIGQSNDANRRIREHWTSLSLGIHPNSALQQLWNEYGDPNFIADLVAAAPDGLSSIARQNWLADSEIYYIGQGKKYGDCLNKYSGGLVLTQELRDLEGEEDRFERRSSNETIKKRRQEIKAELKKIDGELENLEKLLQTTRLKISELEETIKNKTGIRSWFYGSMEPWEKESNESLLSSRKLFFHNTTRKIDQLNKNKSTLSSRLGSLKKQAFKL